jgi:hypothetical protein
MSRRIARLPWYLWLLWGAAALVLVSCPMLMSDPAMWVYLLDPELLVLVVVIGLQYTRLEAGVVWLQLRTWLAGRRGPGLSG